MSAPSHPHVSLFTLHGGGQVGEDSTRPRFSFYVERTTGRLLSTQPEAV